MNDSLTVTVVSKQDPALTGTVTLTVPTALMLVKIGLLQAKLRGGVPLDQLDTVSAGVVVMLSTLAVVVVKAPDWWYDIIKDEPTGKELSRTPAPERVKDLDLLWDLYGRWVAMSDAAGSPPQPPEASLEVTR